MIVAKVAEITPQYVKYQKYKNGQEIIYIIYKKIIASIKYANGTVDFFKPPRTWAEFPAKSNLPFIVRKDKRITSGLWIFGIPTTTNSLTRLNAIPVVSFFVNYEKLYVQNRLGVFIMPFVGANRKAYGAGVGLNYYPKNYGKFQLAWSHMLNFSVQDFVQTRKSSENVLESKKYQTVFLSSLIHLGLNYHLKKNLTLTQAIGAGVTVAGKYDRKFIDYNQTNDTGPALQALCSYRIGLAYRF